jgi:hypothetical protein
MYLEKFETMEVMMLMSIINMKLRNDFSGDLDDLAKTHAIDRRLLETKLATADLKFDSTLGRFL